MWISLFVTLVKKHWKLGAIWSHKSIGRQPKREHDREWARGRNPWAHRGRAGRAERPRKEPGSGALSLLLEGELGNGTDARVPSSSPILRFSGSVAVNVEHVLLWRSPVALSPPAGSLIPQETEKWRIKDCEVPGSSSWRVPLTVGHMEHWSCGRRNMRGKRIRLQPTAREDPGGRDMSVPSWSASSELVPDLVHPLLCKSLCLQKEHASDSVEGE